MGVFNIREAGRILAVAKSPGLNLNITFKKSLALVLENLDLGFSVYGAG